MKNVNLFLIDYQNDFVLKDGNLAVNGAEKDIENFKNDVKDIIPNLKTIFISRDFHKENAPFFVSENEETDNPDKWPKHCVENTNGCRLHENVLDFLKSVSNSDHIFKNLSNRDPFYLMTDCGDPSLVLITKGYGTEKEEYSAFSGFVENKDVLFYGYKDILLGSDLYIFCGEALDYCVYNSVKDFINLAKEYDSDIVNKIVVSTLYSSWIGSADDVIKLYRKLGIELTNKSFEEMIVGEIKND